MTSTIAWLDASSAEQRQMRDIIRLFAVRDSRDELGLGQIRDTFSDILFPGSSTLQTRARYMLFIPWIYNIAADRNKGAGWAADQERILITALKESDDFAGTLGMRAGKLLKTLPSAVYWNALRTYEILVDSAQGPGLDLDNRQSGATGEGGETRRATSWSTTLPPVPEGFPRQVSDGFALSYDEAAWLRERMFSADPESLYGHLLDHQPDSDSSRPWLDSAALSATGSARRWLDSAHLFSTVVHAAQLLYNLLLAEVQLAHGYADDDQLIVHYRDELSDWKERVRILDLRDPEAFNILVAQLELRRGSRIHPRTSRFVRDWYAMLREMDDADLAESPAARDIVERREKTHKGVQSRLAKPQRLERWPGGSGAGALEYRWSTVRDILSDIHTGLGQDKEAAGA